MVDGVRYAVLTERLSDHDVIFMIISHGLTRIFMDRKKTMQDAGFKIQDIYIQKKNFKHEFH